MSVSVLCITVQSVKCGGFIYVHNETDLSCRLFVKDATIVETWTCVGILT